MESKPYGGYPRNWDANLLEKLHAANGGPHVWKGKPSGDPSKPYGTVKGKTIFEAGGVTEPGRALGYLPADEEWRMPNRYEDVPVGAKGERNKFPRGAEQLPTHSRWVYR